jgi:tRNA-Thr(GGU) m(6)t(6)A37 methyltransferase TsaA
MEINIKPVAWVKNNRNQPMDDYWGDIISEIILDESMPEKVLDHIDSFSHLEIIYYFNQVSENDIVYSGRPRGNPDYPEMGIFAQRKKDRPNRIGLSTVELLWHRGRSIGVKMLDAIDGTPVIDIKPVLREFSIKTESRQPDWSSDLMKSYWREEPK